MAAHQTMVWRYLQVLDCRGQAAEALALDALVIAVQKGMQQKEPAVAAAFLRQTARYLWSCERRGDRRRAAREAVVAEQAWQVAIGDGCGDEWLEHLGRCVETLPERSRLALERTYRDGLGRAELGIELGITENGVRTLLQRLRAALRACIERRSRS